VRHVDVPTVFVSHLIGGSGHQRGHRAVQYLRCSLSELLCCRLVVAAATVVIVVIVATIIAVRALLKHRRLVTLFIFVVVVIITVRAILGLAFAFARRRRWRRWHDSRRRRLLGVARPPGFGALLFLGRFLLGQRARLLTVCTHTHINIVDATTTIARTHLHTWRRVDLLGALGRFLLFLDPCALGGIRCSFRFPRILVLL
jgi:hypothetical protein